MARRRRRNDALVDQVGGTILTLVGVVLIVSIGILGYWLRSAQVPVEASTLCPESGPTSVHVILIDRSDPVSGQQAQHIRQVMQRIKDNAQTATRFDIFSFDGDAWNELPPIRRICVPKRPEDANELYENKGQIRKRFETEFSSVFDKTIDDQLTGTTRPSSPIIESLHAAAQTSFGSFDDNQIPLRMTLVSDMVQHSKAVSHLRNQPDFNVLSKNPDWTLIRPRLKGAETDILYILRPTATRASQRVQNQGHQVFWEQVIAASGGQLTSIEPF